MDAPLLILYGSQTGNAQDVAERLAREAQLLLFRPRLMPMDAYDVTQLPEEHLVLCVAATTGQGDPPDNMRKFWRFLLRKSLPPDSLARVRFAVFGLGDSGYQAFNVTAKKLAKRLETLGARPVLGVGLGDDQHPSGYEAALDAWAAAVWPAMRGEAGPLPDGVLPPVLTEATLMQLGAPKYQVTLLPPEQQNGVSADGTQQAGSWPAAVMAGVAFKRVAAAAAGAAVNSPAASLQGAAASTDAQEGGQTQLPHSAGRPFFARVRTNQRITAASHFQDTRHLVIDLQGSGVTYEPGDVLAVLPRTPDPAVDALLTRLRLDPGQRVCVAPAESSAGGHRAAAVQCTATVRQIVQGALDVAGASPRRYFFQVLGAFATSELEKERLTYFASAEGRDELYRYCKREGRTVLEVLNDFKSCILPLEWLLEACPPLLPRLFSISSSQRLHPGEAHLTAALVEFRTPYNRLKRGLCSAYIASLMPPDDDAEQGELDQSHKGQNGTTSPDVIVQGANHGQQQGVRSPEPGPMTSPVACWVERGSIHMPQDLSVPLILVGPGTGVAPFRSFLQHRLALLQEGRPLGTHGIAPCYLFFGCRSQHLDYYYETEWSALLATGVLAPTGLVTAFSRDQESKVYVTHRLREHGATIWRVLQQGAAVYVSGSAQKMPAAVASAFREIVQEHGGLNKEEAARYIRQMELTGRYHVEAWA